MANNAGSRSDIAKVCSQYLIFYSFSNSIYICGLIPHRDTASFRPHFDRMIWRGFNTSIVLNTNCSCKGYQLLQEKDIISVRFIYKLAFGIKCSTSSSKIYKHMQYMNKLKRSVDQCRITVSRTWLGI
jgi:hypothetical protein